jgi:hypothetical protein
MILCTTHGGRIVRPGHSEPASVLLCPLGRPRPARAGFSSFTTIGSVTATPSPVERLTSFTSTGPASSVVAVTSPPTPSTPASPPGTVRGCGRVFPARGRNELFGTFREPSLEHDRLVDRHRLAPHLKLTAGGGGRLDVVPHALGLLQLASQWAYPRRGSLNPRELWDGGQIESDGWWGQDSNLRRQSQWVYSPSPLTTRTPHQASPALGRGQVDSIAGARLSGGCVVELRRPLAAVGPREGTGAS